MMRLFVLAVLLFATAEAVEKPDTTLVAVQAVVTGYCPCAKCCGPNPTGLTSTGLKTSEHPNGIAAAPKLIPYGTQIMVPGYCDGSLQTVDDTGGAMRQDAKKGVYHIDLRFATHQEALNWGRKKMTIYLVKK